MSQIDARMYIVVKDTKDWKPLYDIDFIQYQIDGTGRDIFEGTEDKEFLINGDWSPRNLEELVETIAEAIGRDKCLIIADTTNYNVDPYDDCYYSLGKLHGHKYVDETEMFFESDILNIKEWLDYADIDYLTEVENFIDEFE